MDRIGYAVGCAPTYTDKDVGMMRESESACIWEGLNAPPEHADQYMETAILMKAALDTLGKAINQFEAAAVHAEGLPLYDKLYFFVNDFEDRKFDLKRMMDKARECKEY